MKRAFDAVCAVVALVILAPVFLLIVILVRRSSDGPAIFAQERVGRQERVFRCYKFRTMRAAAPNAASHDVPASWITPLGRTLRRYKIDELPQLWNVLGGEMSLVGPRPCLPSQTPVIRERRKLGVFAAAPGITGTAQLAGIDMSMPERLAIADSRYLETRTFLGDLAILFATVRGSGSGDAVNR